MPQNTASTQPRPHLVKVGQRSIHVTEAGSGEPVILLHGGGPGASGASHYARNIEPLSRQFRVLVPDMPGYGESTKGVNRSDPFGDLANGILGLMDALNIDQAHIVGNSLGGACALRMALDAPIRVASLVLIAPGGVGTTRRLPTPGLNSLLNYYGGTGPSLEKLETFIRDYLVYDGSQVPMDMIAARYEASIKPEVVAAPPLRRPNSLKGAMRMDFTRDKRLKQCSTPTLVLWGTEDQVNRPSGGTTLLKLMPNCDMHLFSNTGHWTQWERADDVNGLTVMFILKHALTGANS